MLKGKKKTKVVEEKPKTMDYFTMLATRRPTPMQKILDKVPRLAYSVPRNGLPAWKEIPLDRALPYIRIPANTICFTKGKMGARLYPQPKGAPFNTCPSPAPEYDAMFDPNLRAWLRKSSIRHDPPCRPLEPPCTQEQYIKHRRLLQRVWSKLAFLELRKQDNDDLDQYIMRKMGEIRERARYNALKEKIKDEQMKKVLEQREEEYRLKQEDIQARQRRMEMRILRCKQRKAEQKRQRIKKAWEKSEMLRRKSEAGKEIARMKLIKTLRTMRVTDNRVKRQLQANIDNRNKKMTEEDARRWAALWKSQNERRKLKFDTMKAYSADLSKKVKIDLKEKKHAKDWKDENLRSMQIANLKLYSDVEKKHVLDMKSELVKRWKAKLPLKHYKLMRKVVPSPKDDIVTEAVHIGINGRSESMTSIDRADYWLFKWEHVPRQVRCAINTILGRVVVQATKLRVLKTLNEVKIRAQKALKRKLEQVEAATNTKGSKTNVGNRRLKCIPRSPSRQEMLSDLKDEKNASDELDRSIKVLRRVLTFIIRDHISRGYDPVLKEFTSLPRTVERQEDISTIAAKLAVYVSHTRGKDIKTSAIIVRKTAEDMLREMIRLVNEEREAEENPDD